MEFVDGMVKIHTMASDGSDSSETTVNEDLVTQVGVVAWFKIFSWSPVGSEFIWGLGPVWVTSSDGSTLRTVVEGYGPFHTAWSPDGSKIAVHVAKPSVLSGLIYSGDALYTVAPDGSDRQVLVRGTGGGQVLAANADSGNVSLEIAACSNRKTVPDPEDYPDLVGDCETLLRIRDTLAGEGGSAPVWYEGGLIWKWNHIEIAGVPRRVEMLGISGDPTINISTLLRGTIPPEIGDLTGLKGLRLIGHRLSGGIPPELGNLVELELLDLSNNGLTGSVPPELGNLVELELLDLSNNGLTGVSRRSWETSSN